MCARIHCTMCQNFYCTLRYFGMWCSRISIKGSQPVDLAVFAKVTNRPLPELYLPCTNKSTDTPIHLRQEDRLVVTAVMTSDTSNCVKCLRGVIRSRHCKRSPLLDKDLRFCAQNIALAWICIVRHSIRVIRKVGCNEQVKTGTLFTPFSFFSSQI